ncbi:MAG: TIGR00296 family protein [Methanothrix sp.]|nr:TIGR00296 family protein [Methanothrix sp.]
MLTLEEGRLAVRLARQAIAAYTEKKKIIEPRDLPPVFEEKRGVFVTLHKDGELRGCIGYPLPIMPLGKAIVDSAINACSRDPRFPCVRPTELERIEVEVTILTPPELYAEPKKRLPELVVIGRDGLIVTRGPYSGLLLPQVAPEWGFDSLEFLSHTCLKAGLPPDAWLDEETEVQHFQAQIFAEVAPGREVFEKSFLEGSEGTCGT